MALSTAELEPGDSLEDLARAIDVEGRLVVIDGGEQLSSVGLDELDDLLTDLRNGLNKAQIVVTSQVDLPRVGFDKKFRLSGLDYEASRRLLRSLLPNDFRLDSESELLDFAEGRPLTWRLVASLIEYFGSGQGALEEINRGGTVVVEIPKRGAHNRATSLRMYLNLAYRALNLEEQRLLFVIANCPGGVFSNLIERYIGTASLNLIAGLRRWSLIQRQEVGGHLDRWYTLSPIGSFVRQLWREANEVEASKIQSELLYDFSVMASVIDSRTKEAKEVPYMVWRLSQEWRNLLLVTEQAEAHPDDPNICELASRVCSSMVRFFFILRLPEEGVRMMIRSARITMRSGNWKLASGSVAEAVGLAQRSDAERLLVEVEDLFVEFPAEKGDAGYVSMTKAMLASRRGNLLDTEKEAKNAIRHYERDLKRLVQSVEQQSDEEIVQTQNHLSGAYQMVGFTLLAKGNPHKARSAYEYALKLVSGHSRIVNEGQILYQIGRCQRASWEPKEAIGSFAKAAVHFQTIGIRDYLSNAIGELGYTLLELKDWAVLPQPNSSDLLQDAMVDAVRSMQQCIVTQLEAGTSEGEWVLRKLFGTIVVLSLLGEVVPLKESARGLPEWLQDLRESVDTTKLVQRAAFEIMHFEALIELMLSIVQVEEKRKLTGEILGSDVDMLVERCASMGIRNGLESSAFEWLEVYLQRARSMLDHVDDGTA